MKGHVAGGATFHQGVLLDYLHKIPFKNVSLMSMKQGIDKDVTTVEPVYIEHSREMKKCSMYAGVQCIQVLSNWRSGEIKNKIKGN